MVGWVAGGVVVVGGGAAVVAGAALVVVVGTVVVVVVVEVVLVVVVDVVVEVLVVDELVLEVVEVGSGSVVSAAGEEHAVRIRMNAVKRARCLTTPFWPGVAVWEGDARPRVPAGTGCGEKGALVGETCVVLAADHEPHGLHWLVPCVVETMRCGRVEGDGVTGPELVLLEADLNGERP